MLYGTELRELKTWLIDDNFHWVCFQFSNGEMLSFLTYMIYVICLFLWVPLNDTTKVMLSLVLHELLNNSQLPERCLVFLFKFIFASLYFSDRGWTERSHKCFRRSKLQKSKCIYICVFTISLYKGVKRVIAVIIPKFSKGLKWLNQVLRNDFVLSIFQFCSSDRLQYRTFITA